MTQDRGSFKTRRPGARGKYIPKRRVCLFCRDKVVSIDYKDATILRPYISDRGKIAPRRKSGACSKHQRLLATSIKRARQLAILPYVAAHIRKAGGVGLRS